MAKTYTTISVPLRTKARWDMMKSEMYGDLAEQVSQEKMTEDLLDKAKNDL